MRTLLVSYDLNKPGQFYAPLIDAIKGVGTWCHPLESMWIVRANITAAGLRDALLGYVDPTDELLVIDVTGDAAAWTVTLNQDVQQWLRTNLPLT